MYGRQGRVALFPDKRIKDSWDAIPK
jgi:hypothetical protein